MAELCKIVAAWRADAIMLYAAQGARPFPLPGLAVDGWHARALIFRLACALGSVPLWVGVARGGMPRPAFGAIARFAGHVFGAAGQGAAGLFSLGPALLVLRQPLLRRTHSDIVLLALCSFLAAVLLWPPGLPVDPAIGMGFGLVLARHALNALCWQRGAAMAALPKKAIVQGRVG